jgi:hypothetical protein
VLDGAPLLGIERIQICGVTVREHESPPENANRQAAHWD